MSNDTSGDDDFLSVGNASSRFDDGDDGNGESSLSWRLPPADSHSDWTVVVKTRGDHDVGRMAGSSDSDNDDSSLRTQTFHVHKVILSIGPRRSDYFSSLFRQASAATAGPSDLRLSESATSTSEIVLEKSAADAFPLMLDFIYSPEGALTLTTEHAVSLCHLGRYFGVRALNNKVTRFIRSDLSLETAPLYMIESSLYHEEKILDAAVRTCAENFESLNEVEMSKVTPELFKRVVTSPFLSCESSKLSKKVANFCRKHAARIDGTFLEAVTNPDIMPRVDADESLFLLNLSISMERAEDRDKKDSLRRRSLTSCSEAWKDILKHSFSASSASASTGKLRVEPPDRSVLSNDQQSEPFEDYAALPATVKIDLLETALSSAERDCDSVLNERDKEIQKLRSALADKEKENVSLRGHIISKSKEVRDLLSSLRSKENEIQTCEMELQRYVRVPKEHRFRDLKTCTFAEFPGDKYGNTPPSSTPLLSSSEREGYLYQEKGSSALWPVYYYKCPY